MYPPPHPTSVLIGEGEGIMLPGKKKAVVPFKLEISQLKAALIPPTISLWRKTFQCNVKYRLIVSVRQEGLNSVIDHEYQIPQMHSFDSSDLAVYMRGQDAVNTFENTTRENIQFKFEFPRILIPGEPWTFSYKFTNLSTKDQKYTVTGLSIDLSELITLNPTTLSALKISELSDLSKTVFSWKSDDTANQDGQHTTKFITPPWPSPTSTALGKDSTRDSGINPSGTWDFLTVSHKITVDVSFKGANKLRYEFPVNVLATYKSTIEELITLNPDLLLGAWGERDGTDEAVASVLLKTLTTERLERAEREKNVGGSEDGGVFGSIEVGNSDEDYIRALHDSLITALAADETATIGLKPNETKYSTSTNFGGDLVLTNSLRTVASSVLPPVSEQGEEEAFIRRLEDLQSFDQAVEATTQQHKNEEQGVKEGELPSYKGIQVEARHRVAFAYFPSKGDEIELRVNDLVVVKKVFKDGWIFDSEDTSTSHSEKSNEKSKKKRGTNELDQLPNISEILEKTAGKLTPTSTILNPTKTTTTEESAFYVSNPDSTRQIIHPHSPWTPVTDPLPNPHQQNQQQNQSLDTKNANINSTTQFPIPVSFAPTIKPLGTPPNTTILGKSSPVGMFTSPLSPFKEPVNAFSGGDKVLDMYSQVAVRGDGGDDTRSIKSSTNTVNSGVVSGGGIENNGTMSSYQWTGSQSGSLKGKKNPSFPRSSSSGSGGGNSGNLRSDGKFSSLNSAYIFPNVPNIPMMGGGSGGIGVGDDVLYSSPSSPYMQFGSIGSSVVYPTSTSTSTMNTQIQHTSTTSTQTSTSTNPETSTPETEQNLLQIGESQLDTLLLSGEISGVEYLNRRTVLREAFDGDEFYDVVGGWLKSPVRKLESVFDKKLAEGGISAGEFVRRRDMVRGAMGSKGNGGNGLGGNISVGYNGGGGKVGNVIVTGSGSSLSKTTSGSSSYSGNVYFTYPPNIISSSGGGVSSGVPFGEHLWQQRHELEHHLQQRNWVGGENVSGNTGVVMNGNALNFSEISENTVTSSTSSGTVTSGGLGVMGGGVPELRVDSAKFRSGLSVDTRSIRQLRTKSGSEMLYTTDGLPSAGIAGNPSAEDLEQRKFMSEEEMQQKLYTTAAELGQLPYIKK